MRILFYIEPAVFRENPAYLSPHLNNVRCFINANRADDAQFAIATSPLLFAEYAKWLRYGGSINVCRYEISGRSALEPFGFDRALYAQDLYGSAEMNNAYLVARFKEIMKEFDPDLVLSPTHNRYLKECFPRAKTAFYEVGPIPRRDGQYNLFFDFGGHNGSSVLASEIDRISNLPIPDEVAVKLYYNFQNAFQSQPDFAIASEHFRKWRFEQFGGKKVAIIAHSPQDNISYDGSAPRLPTDALTAAIVSKLPGDWVAVPTYHRDMLPSPQMEHYMASEFANFKALPDELKQFGSDPFISNVDAVITVASKAALSAALLGKTTVSLGKSMISGFSAHRVEDIDNAPRLGMTEIGHLLAFLSNAYTRTFEECFEKNGELLSYWRRFVDSNDPIEPYFEFSDWAPERAERLL